MSARIRSNTNTRREDLREIGVVLLLNVGFLALIALLLWPFNQPLISLHLAKGYAILWLLLIVSVLLLTLIERLSGLNADTHYHTYVTVNLAVSAVLLMGWSAFAALTMNHAAVDASGFTAGSLYVVGFLACYIAFVVATSFYKGGIYKVVTLPLVLAGYIVFALWPTSPRALFGWFFGLFGMAGF